MRALFLLLSVTWLGLGFGLVSCSSTPAKAYYVLTSEGPVPSGSGVGIGVGPVMLAGYVDRPNLVLQESGHRLAVADSHRWAGKLEDNIARVVATNLGRELGTGNIRSYPWDTDEGLKYQVSLDVHQLHGNAEGNAVLEASWRIYSLPDRKLITTRSWSGTEPLKADGYDELVAAQSRLVGQLSKEIAKGMK